MSKIIIPQGIELMDALNRGEYICNNCGAIMDLTEDIEGGCDILVCPNCGEEVDEMEYEYEYDEEDEEDDYNDIFGENKNKPPKGCLMCGGPYPYCMISCKMFDD